MQRPLVDLGAILSLTFLNQSCHLSLLLHLCSISFASFDMHVLPFIPFKLHGCHTSSMYFMVFVRSGLLCLLNLLLQDAPLSDCAETLDGFDLSEQAFSPAKIHSVRKVYSAILL